MCLAIIVAAHCTYINNGFIWLDHGDIDDGRAIIPLSQWLTAFVNPFAATGFYRPFVTLLHSLDVSLWHAWSPGFHLTSIMLHCGAALLAPFFIGCFVPLSKQERLALALVFGLHPIGFLPAGCISFRSESLMAIFIFLTMLCYEKARFQHSLQWYAAVFLFTLAACFSKETAFFYVPSFILIWEFVGVRRPEGMQPVKGRSGISSKSAALFQTVNGWTTAASVAAALAVAAGLRVHALPTQWRISAATLPWTNGLATRLAVFGHHIGNLISPLQPSYSDAVRIASPGNPFVIVVFALLIAVFLTLIVYRSNDVRGIKLLFALVIITLLPAMDILPLPRFYSPHYGYLAIAPTAGMAMLLVRIVRRKLNVPLWRLFRVLCLCWGLVAGITTELAGVCLKSDLSFFGPETARDHRFLEGWYYLGNHYSDKGDLDRAWTAYGNALQSHKEFLAFVDKPGALMNQSAVALQRNDMAAADSLLRLAQECSAPRMLAAIIYDRAYIADRNGNFDLVIDLLDGKENYLVRPEACVILAKALLQRGREKEAEQLYRRSLGFAGPDHR